MDKSQIEEIKLKLQAEIESTDQKISDYTEPYACTNNKGDCSK